MQKNKRPTIWITLGTLAALTIGAVGLRAAYGMYLRHVSVFPEMTEYETTFIDLQRTHIETARRNGIKLIATREEMKNKAKGMIEEGRLVRLKDCKYYKIQHLAYSHPYVVPKVERLLADLGTKFQKNAGNSARFTVTSVTRTVEDVAKLQKVNSLAVKESAHQHGTTVDISYTVFDKAGLHSPFELRNSLAIALRDIQKSRRCYVKFERKSHCYHITIR